MTSILRIDCGWATTTGGYRRDEQQEQEHGVRRFVSGRSNGIVKGSGRGETERRRDGTTFQGLAALTLPKAGESQASAQGETATSSS